MFGDFTIGSDAAASNGHYVSYPNTPIWSGPDPNQRVAFCVTITTPDIYQINTNVYAPDNNTDSFYVDIDNTPTSGYLWDTHQNTTYANDLVSDRGGDNPVHITLTTGEHTLNIYAREPNTRLDKL